MKHKAIIENYLTAKQVRGKVSLPAPETVIHSAYVTGADGQPQYKAITFAEAMTHYLNESNEQANQR